MNQPKTRRGFGVLGVGAVACLACFSGPIFAFLGGLGLAGLASTRVIGALGLAIAAGAAAGALYLRRRPSACAVDEGPVPVGAPGRSDPS